MPTILKFTSVAYCRKVSLGKKKLVAELARKESLRSSQEHFPRLGEFYLYSIGTSKQMRDLWGMREKFLKDFLAENLLRGTPMQKKPLLVILSPYDYHQI